MLALAKINYYFTIMPLGDSPFRGFEPLKPAFFNVKFTVKDKDQFKQMMLEIYNKGMFHGKLPFIIAILSVIAFIFIVIFAYHIRFAQYILVALIISSLVGFLLALAFYIPSSIFKKQVEKNYLQDNFTSPFIYNFYDEGIEMDTPIMKGMFGWQDIYLAVIDPISTIFSFSKQTPNGKAIGKIKAYYGGIIIPFMLLDEETKQQLIKITKLAYQQGAINQLNISKKLR